MDTHEVGVHFNFLYKIVLTKASQVPHPPFPHFPFLHQDTQSLLRYTYFHLKIPSAFGRIASWIATAQHMPFKMFCSCGPNASYLLPQTIHIHWRVCFLRIANAVYHHQHLLLRCPPRNRLTPSHVQLTRARNANGPILYPTFHRNPLIVLRPLRFSKRCKEWRNHACAMTQVP